MFGCFSFFFSFQFASLLNHLTIHRWWLSAAELLFKFLHTSNFFLFNFLSFWFFYAVAAVTRKCKLFSNNRLVSETAVWGCSVWILKYQKHTVMLYLLDSKIYHQHLTGSGSSYLYGFFDQSWKEGMTEEEAEVCSLRLQLDKCHWLHVVDHHELLVIVGPVILNLLMTPVDYLKQNVGC